MIKNFGFYAFISVLYVTLSPLKPTNIGNLTIQRLKNRYHENNRIFKTAVLSAVLLVSSITVCARNYDNNLIYNSEEENGMLVGQTVYKMEGSSLANYMKYNYKYDTNKRMIESQTMKWNSYKNNWENDLLVRYTYEGKTVTTNYYKWNNRKQEFILAPEMTVTMDNPNL